MEKKRMQKKKLVLLILLAAILALAVLPIVLNRLGTDFHSLNSTDRQMLSELNEYSASDRKTEIWKGYDLEDRPIAAVNGLWGPGYLINPQKAPTGPLAVKLSLPESWGITVYRLSRTDPQLLKLKFDAGNFNTAGKVYTVYGNEVFFTKYSQKKSFDPVNSSEHYISFLSHEAFHYFMQKDWVSGGRFAGDLSDEDLSLMADEYDVLAKIQTELAKEAPSKETLLACAKQYSAVMEQRIAANPEYLKQELDMETVEGTAQYVCIKASRIVGYDYGVMYFDNVKNVSFSDVIPVVQKGLKDPSFLADKMPYETGALLCFLLEQIDSGSWQEKLSAQTVSSPVTLYSLVKADAGE